MMPYPCKALHCGRCLSTSPNLVAVWTPPSHVNVTVLCHSGGAVRYSAVLHWALPKHTAVCKNEKQGVAYSRVVL